MDERTFQITHELALDCLQDTTQDLKKIGAWLFRFLNSPQEKLSLYIPYYSKDVSKLALNYVRAFSYTHHLLNGSTPANFEGTCLFDIFNSTAQPRASTLTIDYSTHKENLALWGDNTLTKLDTFIPIFKKEDLVQVADVEAIKHSFKLFKSIRLKKALGHPVLVKLQENILVFDNTNSTESKYITERIFHLQNKINRDEAIQIKNELATEFSLCISVKYPYSTQPTFPLSEIGKKKFKLVFNNRLAYHEILDKDIYILNNEEISQPLLKYLVIDTQHKKELYDNIKLLKEQWMLLGLNKYTSPFPKYWLLFVNPSLNNDEWLSQFKKDFPAVAEKPIINTVEKIINQIKELNWIDSMLNDGTKIYFPELISNRKKRLEFVYNNFKKYINSVNSNIKFIDTLDQNNLANVIVLDSFNVIEAVNVNQNHINPEIRAVVPDYLYFGYNPWIKYHIFNYQFLPVVDGLRELLDENYHENWTKFKREKSKLVDKIRKDLREYHNKYKDISVDVVETEIEQPDLEFTNNEENEAYSKDQEGDNLYVEINKNLKDEIIIPSTEKVLLQKDSLIYVPALSLNVGDLIIRDTNISNLYNSNVLYDKLANIPENVLKYQSLLYQEENIYSKLKAKGISYYHESYFKRTYAIEAITKVAFRIPRRKKDWGIICEFLNIKQSDQYRSFIAYYGRSNQNGLKKMYKSIIQLLLSNNWIGTIGNPLIIESVSRIVSQYDTIFKTTDSQELIEIAETVVSTLLDQLVLTEIYTIKYE